MPADTYTQNELQLSITTPLGADVLLLQGFTGAEALSQPFLFTLELLSEDGKVDFAKLIGKPATVTIARPGGSEKRLINGVISRFVQLGSDSRFTHYLAELRPWLWLLNFASDSRIFQNKSVPDILEAVFNELGYPDFRKNLKGQYSQREYCVQYQESYFDFVCRLLEDEGIFYFFEHTDSAHTLVLADDQDAHRSCPGITDVQYRGQPTAMPAATDLLNGSLEEQVTATRYRADDFNFETPKTQLLITDGDGALARTVYEYPGGGLNQGDAEKRARLRLQALKQSRRFSGDSATYYFTTGYKFTLAGHPRDDANTDYVLREIHHQATQNTYRNHFEAFPLTQPYRPPRLTPKPHIAGAQTALVVGKSGEEIWTDSYGRIKVKFHWDQAPSQDENASCWIRVAQGWAGKGWGQFWLPRIGQEVVVSFLEGDPDRPLVTGAVYNADQTVPYSLPTEATKSTLKSNSSKGGGGFNEIRFEDKKDAEELFMQAQKDMKVQILNDLTETIGNNETVTIKKNRNTTIEEENDKVTVSKGNRAVTVSQGNETHQVGGERQLTVTKDETHTNQANFVQNVSGNFTLKVTGNLEIQVTGKVMLKGNAIQLEAQTTLTNQAQAALTNKSSGSLTNEAGASLTNKAAMLTNEASGVLKSSAGASHTVESSGILSLSGSLIKMG